PLNSGVYTVESLARLASMPLTSAAWHGEKDSLRESQTRCSRQSDGSCEKTAGSHRSFYLAAQHNSIRVVRLKNTPQRVSMGGELHGEHNGHNGHSTDSGEWKALHDALRTLGALRDRPAASMGMPTENITLGRHLRQIPTPFP